MVPIAGVLMAFTCHILARRNISTDAYHVRIKMINVMICIIDGNKSQVSAIWVSEWLSRSPTDVEQDTTLASHGISYEFWPIKCQQRWKSIKKWRGSKVIERTGIWNHRLNQWRWKEHYQSSRYRKSWKIKAHNKPYSKNSQEEGSIRRTEKKWAHWMEG